jgi:hypothetical protein
MFLLNAGLLFIIATAEGKYGIRGICISFHEDWGGVGGEVLAGGF